MIVRDFTFVLGLVRPALQYARCSQLDNILMTRIAQGRQLPEETSPLNARITMPIRNRHNAQWSVRQRWANPTRGDLLRAEST